MKLIPSPILRWFLWPALSALWLSQPGCSRPPATSPPPPKVTVAQPQIGTVTNWDEYPGHIEAVESVEIRPRVAGFIEAIHFTDGAEVRAGDLLIQIDAKPFQADLDRAQADRQKADTRLELARNDLKRAQELRGTKAISEEEYDARNKAAREAESSLASARAAEAAAQINLDYTRIKAPISGRIGRRLVTAGNLVQGGGMMPGTLLATLISVHPMYCYFDVDEQSFMRYRAQSNWCATPADADSRFPCEVGLADEQAFPHAGRLDFYDNEVNQKTGTIRMRCVLSNETRKLVPGMFARTRVPAGPTYSTWMVPAVAVGSDQGQKYVLVVNGDQMVESRPVKVDRQQGTLRAITEGLKAEDRVIVNGLMLARPGVRVEVVIPGSDAAGGTGASAH
jgi:membrane fusion protein, multidrug efflux system